MDILEELEKIPKQPEDLSTCDLLGFDTETTGLDYKKDSIISASLVLRDRQSGEDKVFNFLINPNTPIDPKASAVNGFTQEFVEKNGKNQKEEVEKIAEAILLAQKKGIPLVAYNAKFDVKMLKRSAEKTLQKNSPGFSSLTPSSWTDTFPAGPEKGILKAPCSGGGLLPGEATTTPKSTPKPSWIFCASS